MSDFAARLERQDRLMRHYQEQYAKWRRKVVREFLGLAATMHAPVVDRDPGDEQDPNVIRQCISEGVQAQLARSKP